MTALATALYVVLLTTALAAWQLTRSIAPPPWRWPWATTTALLAIGLPSLVQLTMAPGLLGQLQRDPEATLHGQAWRLLTALIVQDGGWAGATFNLGALAILGIAAEARWGWRRWTTIALCAGVGAQFWGWLVQPTGAGNSVVVFGLAASLAMHAAWRGNPMARLLGGVSLLAGVYLLVGADIHGGAAAIGALLGALYARRRAEEDDPRPPVE